MRQYLDVKRQHRDAIVLFRMGDFYEMFYEDALTASRVLELTLTSRAKDARGRRDSDVRRAVPRARHVPRAARPQGLSRRDLRSGRRSAQGQGHRQARGHARGLAGHVHRRRRISRRASRRFSPPIAPAGVAAAALGPRVSRRLDRRIRRRRVRGPGRGARRSRPSSRCSGRGSCSPATTAPIDGVAEPAGATARHARRGLDVRARARARERCCEQLRATSLAGYGLEDAPAAVAAAGAIVAYLRETQRGELDARPRHLAARRRPTRCSIDPVTLRHLNVVEGADGGRDGLAARRRSTAR